MKDDKNNSSLTVRAIRGATTTNRNSEEEIELAVLELIKELIQKNNLNSQSIISITFSVTSDINACFPASIVRNSLKMKEVALIDCQQMYVKNDIQKCIRILAHVLMPSNIKIYHPYLRNASSLRPDRS
tara:strand:+ start:3971 stop:4357 length:387 start_codon:yes stop_codon:yes gene_type:complete